MSRLVYNINCMLKSKEMALGLMNHIYKFFLSDIREKENAQKPLNFLPFFQRQTPTAIIMSFPSSPHLLHRHHCTHTFSSLTNSITHKASSLFPPAKGNSRSRRKKKKIQKTTLPCVSFALSLSLSLLVFSEES